MARPKKKGLSYFPKDVDYYSDLKIVELLNEYGPLGQTIYDIILTLVYREGYYLAIPLDKLATQIIRLIGNRWVKEKDFVLQVILFCGDIGLLHDALLHQGVITSAGIQKRYAEVTVRNKVDKSLYWLLDGEEPSDRTPFFGVNVAETPVNVAKTQVNVAETTTNQIKEKKSKVNQIKSKSVPNNNTSAPDDDETMIEHMILHRRCTDSERAEISEIKSRYSSDAIRRAVLKTVEHSGSSIAYLRRVLESGAKGHSDEMMPATYNASDLEQAFLDDLLGDDDDA